MANVDKAQRYHTLRRRAELAGTAAEGGLLVWLLWSGQGLYLREVASFLSEQTPGFEEYTTVATFAIIVLLLCHILALPVSYFHGYLLEHRYALSSQSAGSWLRDHLKGSALSLALGAAGASIVYATIRWNADTWWLLSAAVFALLSVALAQLAPVLLLPLFYRFKRLDRPALVERLVRLADRARTQVAGVYEWGLSAQTRKANAALTGLGRTRRILLSDTLLDNYSDDEIEVVLAHELSHHVHHDLWRSLGLQTALLVAGFAVANLALATLAAPLALRGFDDPAGLPLLMLVAGVVSLASQPLSNAASRAHERRADRFALELTGQPDAFISAMRRLGQQNLAEEHPSRLVQWFFYSHPPLPERIAMARAWGARRQRRTPVYSPS